jgi:hypothetical protein
MKHFFGMFTNTGTLTADNFETMFNNVQIEETGDNTN